MLDATNYECKIDNDLPFLWAKSVLSGGLYKMCCVSVVVLQAHLAVIVSSPQTSVSMLTPVLMVAHVVLLMETPSALVLQVT